MKFIPNLYSKEEMQAFAKKAVFVDITINITAGVVLLFAPNIVDQLLFNDHVLPLWFYIILGIGFLLFAGWQLKFFIRPDGFTVKNLRFAAILAWIPVLAFALGLLSPSGSRLLILPKICLWLANVYMLLLGGLYWRMAENTNSD